MRRDVHVFFAGSGPPVVVIPGIQGRWEWFGPALTALAARCHVSSYSLCGDLGCQWRRDPALGFENYLRQLDAIVERTAARVAICGVSYGGFIALRYAATRPAHVSALILASAPAPGWTPSALQRRYLDHPWRAAPAFVLSSPIRLWPEIRAAFDTPLQRMAFGGRYALRVAMAPMIPGLMSQRIIEQQAIDFVPDARAVRAPTLVVTGEPGLDRVVPVESTRQYLTLIDGARYVILERTGHIGLVTRPRAFAAIVSEFVHQHAS
jgi:3-oxoadipate enol-lactonase